MNDHTPGPWTADLTLRENVYRRVHGEGIAVADIFPAQIEQEREMVTANARLIVSAPELLDMVKRLHHNHWSEMTSELNAECGRLIAKATGGAA